MTIEEQIPADLKLNGQIGLCVDFFRKGLKGFDATVSALYNYSMQYATNLRQETIDEGISVVQNLQKENERLKERYFSENDIAEVQTAAYEEGYEAGYENGVEAAQNRE